MKIDVYPPLAPDWPDMCFDTRAAAAAVTQPKSCLARKRREFTTTAISLIGKIRRLLQTYAGVKRKRMHYTVVITV